MSKRSKIITAVFAAVFCLACGAIVVSFAGRCSEDVDKAVAEAIIDENNGNYLHGECVAEGHYVLGKESKGDEIIVYTLSEYAEFGFVNNFFTDISGSLVPEKLTFQKKDGKYIFKESENPSDGSEYAESLKNIFPLYCRIKLTAAEKGEKVRNELWEQCSKYAQEYLEKIGRKAEIKMYSEIPTQLITDSRLSAEVREKNDVKYSADGNNFPYFLGAEEYLKNGARYIYRTVALRGMDSILYVKENADKDIVEEVYIISKDGERSNEKIGELKKLDLTVESVADSGAATCKTKEGKEYIFDFYKNEEFSKMILVPKDKIVLLYQEKNTEKINLESVFGLFYYSEYYYFTD